MWVKVVDSLDRSSAAPFSFPAAVELQDGGWPSDGMSVGPLAGRGGPFTVPPGGPSTGGGGPPQLIHLCWELARASSSSSSVADVRFLLALAMLACIFSWWLETVMEVETLMQSCLLLIWGAQKKELSHDGFAFDLAVIVQGEELVIQLFAFDKESFITWLLHVLLLKVLDGCDGNVGGC